MKQILTALPLIFLLTCTSAQPHTDYYLFNWYHEPNEKVFKILLPQNWISKGGIFRIDPNTRGGAANALEAKLNFMIKNNKKRTASLRWYPDLFYFDSRYSSAGQMGLFTAGSNDFVIYSNDTNLDMNRVQESNYFEFKRSQIKNR